MAVIASHRVRAKRGPMTGSAKQSRAARGTLDFFVVSLLAMTAEGGSRGAGSTLADGCLRRREARDWHAVGRAGHVVETGLVAEHHRGRIAAMLAADADLEMRPPLAAARHADLHQLADAVAAEGDEGIDVEDALGDVGRQEARGVVAADAVGGLRKVVGAEGEELGRLCNVA